MKRRCMLGVFFERKGEGLSVDIDMHQVLFLTGRTESFTLVGGIYKPHLLRCNRVCLSVPEHDWALGRKYGYDIEEEKVNMWRSMKVCGVRNWIMNFDVGGFCYLFFCLCVSGVCVFVMLGGSSVCY
ncbi:hypothetical protein BDW02DRAFT_195631 [Decorospora gaudefroyi]|uniref:Uncharacterized protein n=1 Tax=Decorospora gaudefroyi TaxID=184978 RepID=A0A6A5KTH5_9PLEO|nr:hypothetical protein BDW02DRAFT_195631 [Decorospora gaudefroyi]